MSKVFQLQNILNGSFVGRILFWKLSCEMISREGTVEGTVEDALQAGAVGGAEGEAREKVLWPAWSQNQQSLVFSNEVTATRHPDADLCDFLSAIQATSARH